MKGMFFMRFVVTFLATIVQFIIFAFIAYMIVFRENYTLGILMCVLISAPVVFIGATAAELYYGLRKGTPIRFAMYGAAYGFFVGLLVASLFQISTALLILTCLLGVVFVGILGVTFYYIRGANPGQARKKIA